MKPFAFAIIAILFTSTSFAYVGADQTYVAMNCSLTEDVRQDLSMRLQIVQGGIAGIPQIVIYTSSFEHNTKTSYYARREVSEKVGAPIVYKGKNVVFVVNYSTSPEHGYKRLATLKIKKTGYTNTYKFLCDARRR